MFSLFEMLHNVAETGRGIKSHGFRTASGGYYRLTPPSEDVAARSGLVKLAVAFHIADTNE
ncbi:MAG: hypothetical protein NTY15_12350 [Planctomycetota bacterium]|nr:hypothetical protein [Planctomycetota bacterium]